MFICVHMFMPACQDHYNSTSKKQTSLLYNTGNNDITNHQRMQNCLAMVVMRSPRFYRAMSFLKSLL